jgi:hypothetical protein
VDRVVIPCAASHGSMMASDEDFSSSYDYYYLGKSWLVREIIPKTALIQVSEILQFTQTYQLETKANGISNGSPER